MSRHRLKLHSLQPREDKSIVLHGTLTYAYGMREETEIVLDESSRKALYAALRKLEQS